jgi:hypothetical protein
MKMHRMDNFEIMDVLVNNEWDSLDVEITGDSPDGRSLIPPLGQRLFSLPSRLDLLQDAVSVLYTGYEALFSWRAAVTE